MDGEHSHRSPNQKDMKDVEAEVDVEGPQQLQSSSIASRETSTSPSPSAGSSTSSAAFNANLQNAAKSPTGSLRSLASTSQQNSQSSTSNRSLLDTLGASQNLPALLNDPGKGKQKDFFTRSWGDYFIDTIPIPPSPYVCELPPKCFDKYLRKLKRYRKLDHQISRELQASKVESPTRSLDASQNVQKIGSVVSRPFLDPNFDLSKPETFASIFQISTSDGNFAEQLKSGGKLVQEKLSHQLDSVEVCIASQVAQKSQNFFEVMTYHNALMKQLRHLVQIIRVLRAKLQVVDENSLKPCLELCRLKRRIENANKFVHKLELMVNLHQAGPTSQMLLSRGEFSGALDLISFSSEILHEDLRGVTALKSMVSQLDEMKGVIGKMLLDDFESFISSEVDKETVHVKATALNGEYDQWNDLDPDRLRGVIFGLLRQNSFSFLEALETACSSAVKKVILEVTTSIIQPDPEVKTTLMNLAATYAGSASSKEWIDLFDALTGSLLVLLSRVSVIHSVIREAIGSPQEDLKESSSGQISIPKAQLDALQATSEEVLLNICDQMHERCAKILSQRAKPGIVTNIQIEELTSIGLLVSIFAEQTKNLSGKTCSGLQLSLQSQSVLYVQSFHDEHRTALSAMLDRETWKRPQFSFSSVITRLSAVPSLRELFSKPSTEKSKLVESDSESNNAINGERPTNGENGSKREDFKREKWDEGDKGVLIVASERFVVAECVSGFLKLLVEYCNLCSMLPTVTVELGLRTAELIKFLNSRVCQLLLGAGAINVSGLKTITIRNLALGLRSIELIARVIPHILLHFQESYAEKSNSPSVKAVNGASPGSTKAELKQVEVLHKQFEQAVKQYKDHVDESFSKITRISCDLGRKLLQKWETPKQVPSPAFKAYAKQLCKLHESVIDIWPTEKTETLFRSVHNDFLLAVQEEIKKRNISFDSTAARSLQSDLTFYGQSVLRLNVLPSEDLTRNRFEMLWKDDFCDSDTSM